MSKEQNTIIKGIAILMMLFYHLFNISDGITPYFPLIYIGNIPLIHYLSNSCYPVTFFLIISGYGLTYKYQKKLLNREYKQKHLLKIYLNYWVILLIFISIGYFVRPNFFNLNPINIVSNLTAFHCTWNGEIWFLFPYLLIFLTAKYIIFLIYKMNDFKKIMIYSLTYFLLFIIIKIIPIPQNTYLNAFYLQIVYYIILLFYFILGILLYRIYENKHKYSFLFLKNKTLIITSLCILIIFKSLFKITIIDGIYAFCFILLLNQLSINRYVKNFLLKMGKYSMQMWMIHTFFCAYLFHKFIYGFKYPLIIFIVLIFISYVSARITSYISELIINNIKYGKKKLD